MSEVEEPKDLAHQGKVRLMTSHDSSDGQTKVQLARFSAEGWSKRSSDHMESWSLLYLRILVVDQYLALA